MHGVQAQRERPHALGQVRRDAFEGLRSACWESRPQTWALTPLVTAENALITRAGANQPEVLAPAAARYDVGGDRHTYVPATPTLSFARAARSPKIRPLRKRLPYHQIVQTRLARRDRGKCRANSSLRENRRRQTRAKSRN